MVEKVLKTIEKYKLLENEDKVLVAVSGGPDSMFLLQALQDIKAQYKLELRIAHLNHQLRESAYKEADFVREQAERFGIPCTIEEKDVRSYTEAHKLSLEEAAREVRYDFLERIAKEFSMNKIATGHTLSDEVETFILRVARGTGGRGLLLIPPKRIVQSSEFRVQSLKVIRPLIEITREEVIQFLESKKIVYQIDESNYDIRYKRNFVRHRIVPLLLELAPQFPRQVMRLREILGEEEELLEKLAEQRLKEVQSSKFKNQKSKGEIVLDLKGFLKTPVAIKRRILRETYMRIANYELRITNYPSFEEIENAIRYIENNKGGKKFNLCGMDINKSCGEIKIVKSEKLIHQPTDKSKKLKVELGVPGEVKWDGVKIKSKIKSQKSKVEFDDSRRVYFDFDELSPPLWIRDKKNGDKIKLKVKSEKLKVVEKKLKDIYINEKVPVWEREKIPLLTDKEGILWIVGMRRANRANVGKNTKKVVEVWTD